MPQLLFSRNPRVVVVSTPALEQQAWQSEENRENGTEREKEDHQITQVYPDMDFFADECSSSATASAPIGTVGANHYGDEKVKCQTFRKKSQMFQSKEKNIGSVAVGCDVCLRLCDGTCLKGEERHVIHIPLATPFSTLSSSLAPVTKISPKSGGTVARGKIQKYYEDEEEEECGALSDKGAAWSGCNKILMMCEETSMCDDEAAHSSHNINRNSSLFSTPLMGKEGIATEKIVTQNINHTITDNITSNTYGKRCINVETPVYAINLPQNFVLGLRLPSDTENKLLRWHKGEIPISIPPPSWLVAFLYTTKLRYHIFPQASSIESPIMHRQTEEEVSAISRLEGLCIVALNILAQLGHMQQQRIREEENVDEIRVAQRCLLGDNGIFSNMQEEQIRRWLQRYMPLEPYNGDEEINMYSRERQRNPSWPSAVCIAFHISLDIARALFPSLLRGLESTILAALQPILEVQSVNSVRNSCTCCFSSNSSSCCCLNSSSLWKSPDRRQAVVLLTQRPTSWWDWWREKERGEGSNYNGSCCTTVVSASRGFGALRLLQCFTLLYPKPTAIDMQWVLDEKETLEVAYFLLAGPSLFTGILMDREVTGVLDRAFKEIVQIRHVPLEQQYHDEELNSFQPRVTYALMRCFLLFISWLTFRPEGYSCLLAQNYFGSLLHLAISQQQWQGVQQGEKQEEDNTVLLGVCCHKYFSLVSALIRILREQCGMRRSAGNHANPSRINPWRQLRYGERMGRVFAGDDECTSNTSRSRRSIGSFHSGTAAMETAMAPKQQIPTTRNATTNTTTNTTTTNTTTTTTTTTTSNSTNTSKIICCDDLFSSRELRTLRHNIRELRRVLRVLEMDVFGGCEGCLTPDAFGGGSVDVVAGTKRRRDEEELEKEIEEKKENVYLNSQSSSSGRRFAVSPFFAYRLFGNPENVWEWHAECSDSSGDDVTESSTTTTTTSNNNDTQS
ncbi:hypothetical protein LSM04_004741 [Trypanosoma melophagium]|uniref:uncharacterized protein n=1 Tax=Trypanosoma melophagium TaxID=715481 RepID=UPI00351A252B|nr:hypothetical protein LSM04_004741 [Trypanosoma melophagium]